VRDSADVCEQQMNDANLGAAATEGMTATSSG
jgi:hypothetical protein